jgi:hypothetical protein
VGSIEAQIAHRLLALTDKRERIAQRAARRAPASGAASKEERADDAVEGFSSSGAETDSDIESDADDDNRGPLPSRDELHALRDGTTRLPHSDHFALASVGAPSDVTGCDADDIAHGAHRWTVGRPCGLLQQAAFFPQWGLR